MPPTYPGVLGQTAPAAPAPAGPLSSSGLCLIGKTERGPVNVATLVTSWPAFKDTFGDFLADSNLPLMAFSFFSNGGTRLYVTRVVAEDAAQASAYLNTAVTSEDTGEEGDGSDTTFSFTLDEVPVVPGSFTMSYRRGISVTGEVVDDGGNATVTYQLQHFPVADNDVVISWTSTGARSQTIAADGSVTGSGNPGGTSLNRTTGELSVDFTGHTPSGNVTIAYYYQGAAVTVGDDGAGALTGGATGTINYTTGAVSATLTNAPALGYALTASYERNAFGLTMRYKGAYGNSYRIRLYGTEGFEDDAHATFTRWTLEIQRYDTALASWQLVESFPELHLTDTTDADYIGTVLADDEIGSRLVTLTAGAGGVPTSLVGTLVSSESIGTGDGTETEFSATLDSESCHPTTLTITTLDGDGNTLTVTDDGDGNLEGDGSGTIDYDTGILTVTFGTAVGDGETISATYYAKAEHNADSPFVDTFTTGSDGSALVALTDIISDALGDNEGINALDRIGEMLMVALPDFVGVKAVDQALIDWCAARRFRFALITCGSGKTATEAKNYRSRLLRSSVDCAAMYYPWVKVIDPYNSRTRTIPPLGHVAGIIARTDNTRNQGPAKAPAGVSDGLLSFVYALESQLSRAESATLRAAQVNALVNWAETSGNVVWGANTIQIAGEYGMVHKTRMRMAIEQQAQAILYTKVFEPNTPSLWATIRLQLQSLMSNLHGRGWFGDGTANESFRVICDETINPAASVARGELNVEIAFRPTDAAEFITLTMRQLQQS